MQCNQPDQTNRTLLIRLSPNHYVPLTAVKQHLHPGGDIMWCALTIPLSVTWPDTIAEALWASAPNRVNLIQYLNIILSLHFGSWVSIYRSELTKGNCINHIWRLGLICVNWPLPANCLCTSVARVHRELLDTHAFMFRRIVGFPLFVPSSDKPCSDNNLLITSPRYQREREAKPLPEIYLAYRKKTVQ